MHSLRDCKCCRVLHTKLSNSYPEKIGISNIKRRPLVDLKKKEFLTKCSKPKTTELKEVGRSIIKEVNSFCNANLGKDFTEIITLVPEVGVVKKTSPVERKRNSREFKRGVKRSIEEEWAKTDVDIHLAQRVSFSTRKKQRLDQGFESKKAARERVAKQTKEKTHSPKQDNIDGDTDQLLNDVKEWPHTLINWSEMARKYKICKAGSQNVPQNGGQMLQDFLIAKGVDISPYQSSNNKGIMIKMETKKLIIYGRLRKVEKRR